MIYKTQTAENARTKEGKFRHMGAGVVQKYFLDKRMSDEEQQKMAEMEKKEPLRFDEDF